MTKATIAMNADQSLNVVLNLSSKVTFNDTHRTEMNGEDEGRYGQLVNQVYRLADTSWGVFSMQTLTRTPEFRQATL